MDTNVTLVPDYNYRHSRSRCEASARQRNHERTGMESHVVPWPPNAVARSPRSIVSESQNPVATSLPAPAPDAASSTGATPGAVCDLHWGCNR